MSKADHMLSILWMLKTKKRMTAKQIAEALEIHIRTVYRYIDALCASGVPIISESGHNGGYCLLDHFTETPLFFDMNEQKALIHAARFAQEAGYPFSDVLDGAISKLKRYTNQEQLHEIHRHSIGFDVIHAPSDPALETILKELEISVANNYTLTIEYQTGYGTSITTRNIDPYGLIYWRGKWYIAAYCHLRLEIRSFRVDRIRALSRTIEVFKRPADFSVRRFFLENISFQSDQKESLISVRIQGNPQAINDLCEHWFLGHAIVERSVNHIHAKLTEQAILSYVPHFLLQYGTSIRVLEPPLLKEKLVTVTSTLLQHYQT
ncbi:putative DNA-binding transcriptional regulator YafY [Aneurinibacillus soli]|uniref:HTH domain protein n=1 Tax=Aneurinibacillus soli TaxID=1500254 RepID=A0A0U5B9Y1_9BACL|nr:YafY family protein [Aneurinibacillus soli]PYE61736.1 putative DNA-binding transcriptional regulator YafY [Aneurinibacillus soli]BAU28406.1 HTH domain protein [Aneurinibacillus soli]